MPTILELTTEVRDMINEPTAAAWSDQQLRKWLNEANRDLARMTRHYKGNATVVSVAGQQDYVLSSSVIAVEHAWYNDGSRDLPLTPRHIENMDMIWGDLQTQTGAYPSFFITIGYATGATGITLRLFPVPSVSANNIKLLTAILPTAMPLVGSDATLVDVPPAWYDALADYCTFKALQRDRDPQRRWQEHYQLYIEKRTAMQERADYSPVNREIVVDPDMGYLPRWLVEPEGW